MMFSELVLLILKEEQATHFPAHSLYLLELDFNLIKSTK